MTTKTIDPKAMTLERYAYVMQTLLWSLWVTNKAAVLHLVEILKLRTNELNEHLARVIAWVRNHSLGRLWHEYLLAVDEPGEEVSDVDGLTVFKVCVLACLAAVLLSVNF